MTDEVERLRADNDFLKEQIEKHVQLGIRLGERAEAAEAEIERLREAHAFTIRVVDTMNKKNSRPARWSEPPEV